MPQLLLHQSWSTGWNKKAQWVHTEGSIQRPIAPWANALTTELHLTPMLMRGRLCVWGLPASLCTPSQGRALYQVSDVISGLSHRAFLLICFHSKYFSCLKLSISSFCLLCECFFLFFLPWDHVAFIFYLNKLVNCSFTFLNVCILL